MNSYPRETIEFLPAPITVDGVPVVTGIQYSIVPLYGRPTVWVAQLTVGAEIGVMVQALDPGTYNVFAKITASPEVPVILCGSFQVS